MKNVRLPDYINPIKYRITIKPDLEAFTFEGFEEIDIEIQKTTAEIILHSKEIEVESASVKKGPDEIFSTKIIYGSKDETVKAQFAKKLKPGLFTLKMAFKGVINDHMRGFYRSSYVHEGVKKHLATSQFEATDARRAFPCFDEPEKKAIFELNFIIPEHLTAISNTLPSQIKEHDAGYKIVRFSESPVMSSYLVAMIVGEFEYLEKKTKSGVVVRVHTTPGKKHQGKFALECAVKTLEFYDSYFDIPYPLKTLDMVAIPDFAHGAMENWGAVTYRESALLVDEENSSASNKQWVALVIAHELAHQWFGNLVTMKWWTHLWLNEGFASYIEYLAVDHLFPKWDIWTQFAYNDLGIALSLDGLLSTHAIEIEVHHPNEIGEIFDEVSYSKGSSVIRMLGAYLGEKAFRGGLRYYLKKHAYKNAVTEDLWDAFEKLSKKPVRKMMRNWTSKPGYPVVYASKLGENTLELSQKRFFSGTKAKDNTLWHIPVSALLSQGKIISDFLTKKSKEFKLPKSPWTKLNSGETGFFRTWYSKDLLNGLAQPVRQKKLPALDRLGIIRDLFALAKSGEISAAEALKFSQNFQNENNYTVWVELISELRALDSLLYGTSAYSGFKKFCLGLIEQKALSMGFAKSEGEEHSQTLLKSLLINQAGYFGSESLRGKAKNIFWSGKKIDPDIRSAVYNLTALSGGTLEFEEILKRYKKENLNEEKNRLGAALSYFSDAKLARKSLEFMLSAQVRSQDAPLLINAVYANNKHRAQAWEFVKLNWGELLSRYGHGGHLLARFIKPLGVFKTKEELKDLEKFFQKSEKPGAERTLKQAREQIKRNILWLSRDLKNISNFLNA